MHLNTKLYRAPSATTAPVVIFATPYDIDGYSRSLSEYYARSLNRAGFHFLAVDLPGTGHSDGIATDEYNIDEQNAIDALIAEVKRAPSGES